MVSFEASSELVIEISTITHEIFLWVVLLLAKVGSHINSHLFKAILVIKLELLVTIAIFVKGI